MLLCLDFEPMVVFIFNELDEAFILVKHGDSIFLGHN